MKKLPSIDSLLREAWITLKPSLFQLFKLQVVSLIAIFAISMIFIFLLLTAGLDGALKQLFSASPESALDNINWSIVGSLSFVGILSMWVIGLITQITLIKTIDKKGAAPMFATIRSAFVGIVPLFITMLLVFFLAVGSMTLFVVPGIFVSILLSFSLFAVVLDNKTPFQAIKKSAYVIQENFWQLLLHWVVLFIVYIGVAFIVPNFITNAAPQLRGLVTLASFIVNIILGWYMITYNVLLYKKLAKDPGEKSITWIWIVAILGWMLMFVVGSTVLRVVTSPAFMDAFKKQRPGMQNEKMMQQYQDQYKQQYEQQMEQYESSQDSDTYTQ